MALLDKPNMEEVWASGGAAVKPSDVKIQTGWTAEVPPYQYENWIQGRQDQYLAHVNQRGIPQWDGLTEYEGGGVSYTQGSNGVVYKSVGPSGPSGTVQDPTTDAGGVYWEKAFVDNGDSRIVNAVPNTRTIIAGEGMTGGGTLAANRTLSVDNTVVRTSRSITAGTGLSGGGNLAANRTLSVDFATPEQAQDLTSDDVAVTPGTLGAALGDLGQNIAVFTEAGVHNWPVPDVLKSGKRKAKVIVTGAGGSGSRYNSYAGGGGGAGATVIGVISLEGVSTIPITVGQGGTAASSEVTGGAGGASSFGTLVTAEGGSGATGAGQGGSAGTGGAGGAVFAGSGGTTASSGTQAFFVSGAGGSSYWGGGGRSIGVQTTSGGHSGQNGGGGGGSTGNFTAGNGGHGVVVIEW